MNWHKTNLALILILILIDSFLAVVLYNTYRKTELIPEQLIEEATENLSVRGISFDKAAIDKKIHKKSVYIYSSDTAFAETMKDSADDFHDSLYSAIIYLSGVSEYEANDSINFFDIPGGTSVSITGKDEKPLGTATIEGVTGFEYAAPDFDSEKVRETVLNDRVYASCDAKSQNIPSVIRSFFEKVYGDTISAKTVHISECEDGRVVTTLLCADGVYVHNMILSFYIRNNKILYVKGDMFFSVPKKDTDTKITDGINILFNLPENVSGNINVIAQHLEYTLFEASSKENYLVPSWIINYTEEGSDEEKFIILNAVTGNVLDRIFF